MPYIWVAPEDCPICGAQVQQLSEYVNCYTGERTPAWICPEDAGHYYRWRSEMRGMPSIPREATSELLRLADIYSSTGTRDRCVSQRCFGHLPRARRPVRAPIDSRGNQRWIKQLSLPAIG